VPRQKGPNLTDFSLNMVKRLSLKQIREELERKTTLDEKKNHLSEMLKAVKGAKLKAKVEALLAEIDKHREHEEQFNKDELEEKISPRVEPEIKVEEKTLSEIKYVPKSQRESSSGLEREVRSAEMPSSKFASFGPPKYIALEGGGYISEHDAAARARLLLEERGVMKSMSAEAFYGMDPTQKQTLMKIVSEAVGTPFADYENLYSLTKSIAIKGGDKKYETKKW
ncbi:MAG: hypothetical protein V1839_03860, partial [archaeon]